MGSFVPWRLDAHPLAPVRCLAPVRPFDWIEHLLLRSGFDHHITRPERIE